MNRKLILFVIIILTIIIAGAGTFTHFFGHKDNSKLADVSKKQMYHCPMHPSYISDKPGDCPICGMKLVPVNQNEHDQISAIAKENEGGNDGSQIKIDPTTVQSMGVTTAIVENKKLKKEIRTSATLENDETGVYIVNTKYSGYVEKLFIDFTGQTVRKGQPLLTVYSPDLVSTQEEYLQALRYSQGLSGGSQIAHDGAQSLVESAKRRLLNWDISESQIEELTKRGIPQKAMTIFAPANGVILEKMVIAGQNIEAGMALYKIADLSKIWAMANVYQEDLPYIKTGLTAEVELSSMPGKTFEGKVQFISPVLDMNSKTAQVRIEIPNTSDYTLKPQMFANVRILSPVSENGIAIPEQAVIHSGTRNIVIISPGNGYFKPQEVQLGATADGYVEVLDGLKEGQIIVTSSQFLIDSESNLRTAIDKMTGPESEKKTPEKQNNVVFICPMDKDVVSDKPGKCPKCGMDLVKKP
jgi:Cu(I)/Ag(I) efflux system membrane fusion protein